MKKITLLLIAFFLSWHINAQLYQVPTCSGGISTNIYGNMNSIATTNATSRSAMIYPSAQLAGISGQVLNAVYLKRMAASGTMGGSPTLKVYLKETSATDFGAAAIDWATEIATATLVYDSNPSAATGSSAGWKSFNFSTNFTYSGTQNLAVYMEYVNTAASTAIGWDYEYGTPCISTTNSNTTKYINNTTGTPGASLTSTNYRRPQIGFDYVVTCPAPTSFNYANLTATTVDLNWVAGGSEGSWEYVIQPSADPAPTSGTTIGANAVIAASVSPNTAYTAYLRANCGAGGFSVWRTVTFTTPCASFSVPSTENFATYVPGCWQEADNGDVTAGPATFGASSWIADGFGNNGTTGATRMLIDATGDNDWLLSPLYTIPASGYELKFDAAATQSGTTNSPTTPWESDDFVEVLVSTGTSNWTLLYTYNDGNVPSNTGTVNIIDLDAYAGQNVRFAFRAVEGATNGSASIDFSIDNFEVRLTPACPSPLYLGVNSLTTTSANLTWTAGGSENTWNVEWGVSGFTQGTGTLVSGITPSPLYSLSSLTPNTSYQFYVQANCGGVNGVSTWAGPYTFYTGYCTPSGTSASSYINNFSTTGGTVNISNLVSGYTAGGYQDNYNTQSVSQYATGSINFTNEIVGGTVGCAIWVDFNNDLAFSAAERVYNTTSYGNGPFTGAFAVPVGTAIGDYRMRVLIDFNASNPSNPCGFASGRGEVEDYKLTVIATPSCLPPPALTANNVTYSSANITWGATTGSYEYVLDSVATDPVGSGTPLSGEVYNATLAPSTTYYFHVRTICSGSSYSSWSTISFTTPATPPSNDDCANAIVLTAGGFFGDNDIIGTTVAANTVTGLTYACQANRANDVWYSVTVPTSGSLTIETQADGASVLTDTVLSVFSGTCGTLTEVGCSDDEGTGNFSIINLTGQTPGATLYIGVWRWSSATNGTFLISAYDASLSTESFDVKALKVYPNPVKDVLNLSHSTEISSVEVFNMLGQKVLVKQLNVTQTQIDMSSLNAGNYLVKITSQGETKTMKILKD